MKVKDVIICALKNLNLPEVAAKLTSGEQTDAYESETADTLLCCYNAVEDELARRYLPLLTAEEFAESEIFFTQFTRTPVKIKKVTAGGREVKYSLTPQYLKAEEGKVKVEYFYAPAKKRMDGICECAPSAGENLLAYGICAEYCFINGEAASAETFENKYRQAIDAAQSRLRGCGHIPPRRWV